jgi:hypothetical protein
MRGFPNHPVTCSKCGSAKGCPKDSLCHGCRVTCRPNANKRFCWTTDLDSTLTRAYRSAHTRRELSSNLNHIQRLSSFTRVVILSRAAVLGLSFAVRRPWTETEIELLGEDLGTRSQSQIAKRLGRTYYSVKAQVSRMGLSACVSAHYSQHDVQQLFGVGRKRVCQWIRNRWLQLQDGRITERSLERFLRQHPEEYQLNRVDEAWFKGMLFPSFGRLGVARQNVRMAAGKNATSVN